MLKSEIEECCKLLKLSQHMAQNSMILPGDSNQEYFLGLMKKELVYREEQRKERNLKSAGFQNLKTFDEFRFGNVTLPSGVDQAYLKECRFIDEKVNLVMYGNCGTGKTHLTTAIGLEACKQGRTVKFYRTTTLVNLLSEAKKNSTLSTFMKQLKKADALLLDEWGYVPLDRDGARLLFEVIADSYEKRSIIITTNIEFSRWTHILFDEQLTGALLDRLLHHCHLLMFDGESERMKTSLLRKI
ncbi:MAG TPA: IS21-like element helper ATPase IstB [Anaerovoracaceae bacterium]|nr:IS21-like element helper ATPase IstB [Anaerovoracaceae bacterium]